MTRLRQIVSAFATASVMATALVATAAPAYAQSGPCSNSYRPVTEFNRCTSTSPNGAWRSLGCWLGTSGGVNYDATAGPYNVIAAINACDTRVWLHQYIGWVVRGGWSYCIRPGAFDVGIPGSFQHPMNIYVSSNLAPC